MGESIRFEVVTREVENTNFDCGDNEINNIIKKSYYPTLLKREKFLRIVYGDEEIGYFSYFLKEESPSSFSDDYYDDESSINPKVSVIHIHIFAIDKRFQKKKIGTELFKMVLTELITLLEEQPIQAITLDAKPHLVKWYKGYGFESMKINKESQREVTEYMYYTRMDKRQIEEYCETQS